MVHLETHLRLSLPCPVLENISQSFCFFSYPADNLIGDLVTHSLGELHLILTFKGRLFPQKEWSCTPTYPSGIYIIHIQRLFFSRTSQDVTPFLYFGFSLGQAERDQFQSLRCFFVLITCQKQKFSVVKCYYSAIPPTDIYSQRNSNTAPCSLCTNLSKTRKSLANHYQTKHALSVNPLIL